MEASAPRIDLAGITPPIGYHQFHPDISINFQCNRWVQWIEVQQVEFGEQSFEQRAESRAHGGSGPIGPIDQPHHVLKERQSC